MPHRIYREWEAFYQLSPFGDLRGDIQAAVISHTVASAVAAVIASLSRGKKHPQKFDVKDFIPDFAPQKPQTADELLDKFKQFVLAAGGEIVEQGGTD